jgi:hypothetical protein
MSPTSLVPFEPDFTLNEKFSYVANKFMQIGSPPKNPDIMLANPNTFDYLSVYPKSPYPKYLFPLLSNSCKYKNC